MWDWGTSCRKQRPRPRAPTPPGPALLTVWIPSAVVGHTVAVLRASRDRRRCHEGVAYWAGRRCDDHAFVTTCIAPAARTTPGSFDTSSKTNAEVVMFLASAGLELLGQVHSHPGLLVDHSDGDDERALMPYDGFLSLVVPRYSRDGMVPLTRCGVHIFEGGGFRRLTQAQVEAQLRIVSDYKDLRK